jgi:hypothetical protein
MIKFHGQVVVDNCEYMILRNNVVLPDRVEISPISLIPYMPNDYRYNFQVAAFNKANSEYTGTISNYITINKTGNFIPTIEASISNSGTVVLNYNVVPPGENPNNYTTTIFKNGKVLADW